MKTGESHKLIGLVAGIGGREQKRDPVSKKVKSNIQDNVSTLLGKY